MTFEQIIKQLESHQYAPVYLLQGGEPFYIDLISDHIENHAIEKDQQDFNQWIVYGKDTYVDEILANVKMFPFGAPKRVVIVKEAQDLSKINGLTPYIENPSPSSILVLCHKYKDAPASLSKIVDKHGVLFNSKKISDYMVPKWIADRVKFYQFRITDHATNILAEHIGNDLSTIDNQLRKLKIILPPGSEITPQIIEQHIGISKEYNIFELQDALANRNKARVYQIMFNFCNHFDTNPNPKTINSLTSFYLKMLAYNLSDKSKAAAKTIYTTNSDWALNKNIQQANSFSIAELQRNIAILREYDAKSKGVESATAQEELLKEMIFKICG